MIIHNTPIHLYTYTLNRIPSLRPVLTPLTSLSKNFEKDQTWTKRQPIFATAEKPIVRIVHNQVDWTNGQKMCIYPIHPSYTRWQNYYNIVSCPRCFAELILMDIKDGDNVD